MVQKCITLIHALEWDEDKATSNRKKHGVMFADAAYVFYDPFAVFDQNRVVNGELRWQAIGRALGETVLMVAHTLQDEAGEEVVRILSARKADKGERKRYGDRKV